MRHTVSLLAAALAIAAIACADQGAAGPRLRTATGPDSGGPADTSSRRDTSSGGDTSSRGDTAVGSTVPGVHGRVWGWVRSGSDTGIYIGVAGAKVQLLITPIDSMGAGDTAIVVTSVTSAGDGTFLVNPVADGWYAVRAVPPAGASYGAGIVYGVTVRNDLMTNFRDVSVVLPIR